MRAMAEVSRRAEHCRSDALLTGPGPQGHTHSVLPLALLATACLLMAACAHPELQQSPLLSAASFAQRAPVPCTAAAHRYTHTNASAVVAKGLTDSCAGSSRGLHTQWEA